MKKTVFLDIDKTLVNGQTQMIMASYFRKRGMLRYSFLLKTLSWFLLYKGRIVTDVLPIMEKSYEMANGIKINKFEEVIGDLFLKEIKPRYFPRAIEEVKKHQENGSDIVLVSNSIDFLAKMIKEDLGASSYIATALEKRDGVLTGKIKGNIVYGEEKVRAIKEKAPVMGWDIRNSYAYTDHYSDIPLLKMVGEPIAVNPDRKLRKEAYDNNWPIVDWKSR